MRTKAYNVVVFPDAFRVVEQATIQTGLKYFNVVKQSNDEIICSSADENNAKFVALSLELVVAYVRGDGAQTRMIMEQLSKIRSN